MRGNPKQIWVFNTVIFSSAQADFFSLCVQYISLGKVQLFRFFHFVVGLQDHHRWREEEITSATSSGSQSGSGDRLDPSVTKTKYPVGAAVEGVAVRRQCSWPR